jgi:hypothetical protein
MGKRHSLPFTQAPSPTQLPAEWFPGPSRVKAATQLLVVPNSELLTAARLLPVVHGQAYLGVIYIYWVWYLNN